jgi:hypothetical protein
MKLKNISHETIIAEGIEFSNENVALNEFATVSILILDCVDSIHKHYESIGKIQIKWIDSELFEKIIH